MCLTKKNLKENNKNSGEQCNATENVCSPFVAKFRNEQQEARDLRPISGISDLLKTLRKEEAEAERRRQRSQVIPWTPQPSPGFPAVIG